MQTNENENTTTQNLWDTIKAVLRVRKLSAEELVLLNCGVGEDS